MVKFSISDFSSYKQKQRKITMVTGYDYLSAQMLEAAQVDIILVGDSLGMVIQGAPNTAGVTVENILYHTRAVRLGAPHTFILADMPFLSYHLDLNTTIKNAAAIMCQGGADAVKLEINHPSAIEHVKALIAAQIPVIGHVGLTPQSVNLLGGFKVQGKTEKEAAHILSLINELEQSGAFAVVLECIPESLTQVIANQSHLPTIGIGAGKYCDGQVLVFHDLLGFTDQRPKFAQQFLAGRKLIIDSLNQYIHEVRNNIFPAKEHSYK